MCFELFHRCLYVERNLITTYPLKTIVPVDDCIFAANEIQPDQVPCIIDRAPDWQLREKVVGTI
jgi:hypothetical protein